MANPALHQIGDAMLDCPHCGEAGRHRVVGDRDETLLWCQTCFRVRVEGPVRARAEALFDRGDGAAAERISRS